MTSSVLSDCPKLNPHFCTIALPPAAGSRSDTTHQARRCMRDHPALQRRADAHVRRYRLTHCRFLRAFFRAGFFGSTTRGSRLSSPIALRAECVPGSSFTSARATPSCMASDWPFLPEYVPATDSDAPRSCPPACRVGARGHITRRGARLDFHVSREMRRAVTCNHSQVHSGARLARNLEVWIRRSSAV